MSDTAAAEVAPATDGGPSGDPGRRRPVAPFVVLAVAVALGALFIVLARSDTGGSDEVESYLVGRAAPQAVGTTLDGEPFDLARRKGSWVVLNFFDPTCIPCIEEHPELIAFDAGQQEIRDGAELYTIINRGSDDAVRDFFTDNGGDWPVVSDPTGSISVNFGVAKVPETWDIDPNGIIRVRYPGTITDEALSTQLQSLREAGL